MPGRRIRLLTAGAGAAARAPLAFLRAVARLPLELEAEARIASLPTFELVDITEDAEAATVRLPRKVTRHEWSLGAAEQVILQALVQARRCRTAFEVGTFNGGTTRLLAETLPDEGRIWTIDLPPDDFDRSQGPSGFRGDDVGGAYRDSPAVGKIIQLLGDSLTFDFSPYEGTIDLVLVDAGHEYANGAADTRTALRLVRPGGIVLWDDFEPYWHGLVNGICDAMEGHRFGRLAGTSLAVFAHPG